MALAIEASFHPATWTLTYLVWDVDTLDAVVVDPVLDYEPATVGVSTDTVDALSKRLAELGLNLRATLETHAHADHITGADELRKRFGSQVVAGARIVEVQAFFGEVFDFPGFEPDGSDFDVLARDGQMLEAGSLRIQAIATPGHTPACTTYRIGDAIFTGDTLFMPDFGTGRCDFPNGDASVLYDSIQKLYQLPEAKRVFVGHGYQPGGRDLAY
ncbi:MAG: MBL fold metallo-hydrolase, partial [Proteobacteria bacterium]|nr:MBL fold metallo-hydrolase [Pseudomonadota bacterium]